MRLLGGRSAKAAAGGFAGGGRIGGRRRVACSVGLALIVCAAASGCGVFRAAAPESLELPDGHRRLGSDVRPLHYALDLEIDPASGTFAGSLRIDVRLDSATRHIALHAEGLKITEAYALVADERRSLDVRIGENGGIALLAEKRLPAGAVSLHLRWHAPLGEVPRGLYRVNDGAGISASDPRADHWYAFTQFEPLSARQAFPCFDQPDFKTPFDVTLRVPAGLVALSSGPEVERLREGDVDVFRFGQTQPLPTYLVAFAVGDFEITPVPNAGVPTRIITARGKIDLAGFAARRTPVILGWLERYFDRAYPFAKLDLIAVPNFSAGAMENVGLVTFRESILLLDDDAPVWDREYAEIVIAHELAHMWFGNLVTMPWWDDLWLNEGFASWMAAKAIAELVPSYELLLGSVRRAQYVMTLDAKRDARSVRQPIASAGDVYNAFDGITYGKGSALLRMLEAWLGEERFRDGVRSYLNARAHGSGSTTDLLATLEEVSGLPVAATIRAFLDQPGTPLVEIVMTCEEGRPAELDLMQRRYLPAGSTAPQGETWQIPMCVRYGMAPIETAGASDAPEAESYRECFVMDAGDRVQQLGVPGCPSWLHPNSDEAGYYRWSIEPRSLNALVGSQRGALALAERVALSGHLEALLIAEKLSLEAYVDGLVELSRDRHRDVIAGVAQGLSRLDHVAVDDPMREDFASAVRELLGPHLDRIGLMPVEGEGLNAEMLRASLVWRLADFGQDTQVREAAAKVADSFFADPDSVSPAALDLYLSIAARSGDAVMWKALVDALPHASSPSIRREIVVGLGSFREPALLESSFDLILDGTLRSQDYRTLLGGVGDESTAVVWEWLMFRYEDLLDRLGPMTAPRLPQLASSFCSVERAAEVEAFFEASPHAPSGTARNLSLALESIARCVRLRGAIREPLRDWLAALS